MSLVSNKAEHSHAVAEGNQTVRDLRHSRHIKIPIKHLVYQKRCFNEALLKHYKNASILFNAFITVHDQ